MKRVLLDTNVYSRGLAGEQWAASILRQAEELLICPIVAGELFAGFRKGSRESHNLSVFRKFLATPRVTILNISLETSEFYCTIIGQLQRNGTPIPTNDIWIAACTMENGAHLATMDSHFKHVGGLLTVWPEN
jgi:tRNA(fMet)-specific endonuclease VapC